MKKAKAVTPKGAVKTVGTQIVEKYRPRMNHLTAAERKRLLEEGLAIVYKAAAASENAHRRLHQRVIGPSGGS